MLSHRLLLLFFATAAVFFASDHLVGQETESRESFQKQLVFFGNGVRNGWVDGRSIVLLTRTTKTPELNMNGKKFLIPKGDEKRKLIRSTDSALQESAQMPQGATLDEMEGACPGIAATVTLSYWPENKPESKTRAGSISTKAESDYIAQWKLTGLEPGTRYVAELTATVEDSPAAKLTAHFKTAHAKNSTQRLKFCMTTCHDFPRRDAGDRGHAIYKSMTKIEPDFTVHAGDIEYYDQPYPLGLTVDLMRFHWQRFFGLPDNRDFYTNHSTYFMKDDHDTLKNDCWPGQRYGSVTFEQGKNLFNQEQFPSNEKPFKTVRWGRDLQIWMIEGRDYRSPNNTPDGPDKTILGEKQKRWLMDSIKASDATFRIIFSPTPILGPDRLNKNDNHANRKYSHEGDQIREFLAKQINVFVMCGDRHWQYATKLKESGLWEFGCGPGSEEHQLGWKKNDKREEHEFLRVAGGFLSGEVSSNGDTSKLQVRHHSVDGKMVNEIEFTVPVKSK